jgi:hypothetical protein
MYFLLLQVDVFYDKIMADSLLVPYFEVSSSIPLLPFLQASAAWMLLAQLYQLGAPRTLTNAFDFCFLSARLPARPKALA